MSTGFGLAGTGMSMLGANTKQRQWKDLQKQIKQREGQAVTQTEARGEEFRDDPLLNMLRDRYMEMMDAGPTPGERRGIFDLAQGGVQDLFSKPYGLSDPRVQQQIYDAALEEALIPAHQQASRAGESQMAARGMGRSGMAVSQQRQRESDLGRTAAGVKRTIGTEGAMQELQDMMTKIGAAQGLYGQASEVAGRERSEMGGFGLQREGLLNQLTQMLNNVRMGAAGMLGGMQVPENAWSAGGQGLMQTGGLTNQNPWEQFGARSYYGY